MEVHVGFENKIAQLLESRPDVLNNPSRELMIREGVDNREAIVSATGALAVQRFAVVGRLPSIIHAIFSNHARDP